MSKIFGYKEGHTLSHNGKNLDYEKNSCSEPFMRIKHDVFIACSFIAEFQRTLTREGT
jgi:hypothetical protein